MACMKYGTFVEAWHAREEAIRERWTCSRVYRVASGGYAFDIS